MVEIWSLSPPLSIITNDINLFIAGNFDLHNNFGIMLVFEVISLFVIKGLDIIIVILDWTNPGQILYSIE